MKIKRFKSYGKNKVFANNTNNGNRKRVDNVDVKAYERKQLERQMKIIDEDPKTPIEKAINDLEFMICNIRPYSRAWRWGHIKSLKLAIKVLKNNK
jgi:hypothetical protein